MQTTKTTATIPAAPGWNIATFRHSEQGEWADCFSFEPIAEFEILRIETTGKLLGEGRMVVMPITVGAGGVNRDPRGPFAIKSPAGKFESLALGISVDSEAAALEAFRRIFVDKAEPLLVEAKPATKRRQRKAVKANA